MESLKALASRKVAGIPLLYIALVVAAVAVYGALKMKTTPDPVDPTDAAATDTPDTQGDLPDTSQPVFQATPVIYQPSGVSVSATPQEDTNDLWARRSITYLTANGATLSEASGAITKYLDGETLSAAEGVLRDKAVKVYGLPPEEGVLNAPTNGAPVTPAARQGIPPLKHVVRNSRDDTPAELSLLYYGSKAAVDIDKINAANSGKPFPYPVGSSITVPHKTTPRYFKATARYRTLPAIASHNGTSVANVTALNPTVAFPAPIGTRVRVR